MTSHADTTRATREGLRAYDRVVRRRVRVASVAHWLRAGGIQAVWILIVVAGAAIPVTESIITDGWDWVSPVLGFVVVVAAGLERILDRTTPAATALDELRRELAAQRRRVLAGELAVEHGPEGAVAYVERVEEAIRRYDDEMLAYARTVLADPG